MNPVACRRLLACVCALAFTSWLLTLAGVAASTGFACAAAGVGGRARVGGEDLVGGAAAGLDDSSEYDWLDLGAMSGGSVDEDTFPVVPSGSSSDGGRRRLMASPAGGMAPFPSAGCGSSFGLAWWAVAFHLLVFVLAARSVFSGRAAAAGVGMAATPATSPLAPLFAVGGVYATWCANTALGAAGSAGLLTGLFAGLDALLLAAQPGKMAAAQCTSAGFVLLAGIDLCWLVAHAVLAGRAVATQQMQLQHQPPPPPSGLYVYAPTAVAPAAAAIAAKAEASSMAAAAAEEGGMIGAGAA